MDIKKVLSACLALFAMAQVTVAQQPYGGCWHPDYIISWTPEKDQDAKFNRSTLPLQSRITDMSIKANANQHKEGQVAACMAVNPSCSQTPSQGASNFIGYNPTYWQYMDLLIWWGGSAGEGIIIPPEAPVTDIAHLNGVKVLGQLFFPPTAFGGQSKWVDQMLTKEGETYPYAKKMYEIAAYYGFDGWFINEETKRKKSGWDGWIAYYNKCAQEGGHPEMEIQWYDCATTMNGAENIMRQHNSSYFLNYGSPSESNIETQMNTLKEWGFTREESFRKAYFGIEVAQGGLDGNANAFKSLYPANGHQGSIDLFCPEEHTWKRIVEKYMGTENDCGALAYEKMNESFQKEGRFWTNEQHDPSNITGRNGNYFPGFANAIIERSAIHRLPFITSFSAGLGKHRFVNGEKKGTHDWYHRGMQDIMPTWRWWVDVPANNKNDIMFSLNWNDAYNVGTSIQIKGNLNAGIDYLTRLYRTELSIKSGDKFQLVFKGGDVSNMELKVGVAEDAHAFATFKLTSTTTSNGWTVATVDLSSLSGKTVSVIALNFKAASTAAIDMLLGQLAVLPANYSPSTAQVSNITVQNSLNSDGGDIRLIWDAPKSEEIHHFNVYMARNGVKTLVGQTRNEGFYIDKFIRESSNEKEVILSISTVMKDLKEGNEVSYTHGFPALEKPIVSMVASKTMAKLNEEITLTATASNFPESYTWTLPEDAEKITDNGNVITVKFKKKGVYNITVAVANSIGITTKTVEKLIEISDAKAAALSIVSVGKKIHSCSGSLPPEDPEKLIDGVEVPGNVRDKWCIGGSKEHWVVIDLEKPYQIYRFRWFDCGHKENYADNVQSYKIWISNDGETWSEPAVDAKKRPENTKDDYIAPTTGRYVKFMPYDEEKPITIRIWEFEVFAIEPGPLFGIQAEKEMNINTSETFELAYDLNGDAEEKDFNVSVASNNQDFVEIRNVNINKVEQKISFEAVGKTRGIANVKVSLTNNGYTNERECKIRVIDPTFTNMLAGKEGTASYLFWGTNWQTQVTDRMTDEDNHTYWGQASYASGPCDNISIMFDCGESYQIKEFVMNAISDKENFANKIKIYVSNDNADESYKEIGQYTQKTQEERIVLTNAEGRYLKIVLEVPLREMFYIFEIEAYGQKSSEVGLNDNAVNAKANLNVYPNPVSNGDVLYIESPHAKLIQLTNLQGSVLLQQEASNDVTTMPINGIESGIYLLIVTNESNQQTTKIIVK